MRLAAHQPDFLPYSGFWFKMANADVFDLAVWDQFQNRGYQRRVKMRDSWASVPLLGKPSLCPITDVMVDPGQVAEWLHDTVRGRYRGSKYFVGRFPMVGSWIEEIRSEWLWQVNLGLILKVREYLKITTPLAIGMPPAGHGTDGLLDVCRQYGADQYLSGSGGSAYTDEVKFASSSVQLLWSSHVPTTGDSILSVIFDEPDPAAVVRSSS